tara:strand:- start:56 stop:193 length:138 start_codon:yes stop_codon:yes gene_type:complete
MAIAKWRKGPQHFHGPARQWDFAAAAISCGVEQRVALLKVDISDC